jgi:hypothetical protein
MIINRRQALIGSLTSLIAAPAIVRASSLMPVRVVAKPSPQLWVTYYEWPSSTPWRVLAGECIYVGDVFVVHQDGKAYRAPSLAVAAGEPIGIAAKVSS